MKLAEFANHILDEVESTNDIARRLAEEGWPHGTWISARRQAKGRGRAGREWVSTDGNLFLSLVARLPMGAPLTWVPLAAAVAVANVLFARYPSLPLKLKWPNDLWLETASGPAKLGGVLCESSGGWIVIGIGLNCATAPSGLDQATESLSGALGRPVRADDLREELVAELRQRLVDLPGPGGPEALARTYGERAALAVGSRVRWNGGEGEVLGLGTAGELRVKTSGGERRLFAEDIERLR